MTGVGALFELYSEYKDSKKPKEEEKEDVKLEPDVDETVETYEDPESDWFRAIDNRDWDSLLFMLQQFDFKKFKKSKKEKPKRRLRVVKAAHWVRDKIRKPQEEEEEKFKTPLLAVDALGQTPLHAAIANLAPDRLIIRLCFSERKAALVADKRGFIPLHVSTIHERNTQIIDRCIRSNFHHMQQLDLKGRTALWYAVERATQRTKENPGNPDLYWGLPRGKKDMEWQERQEVYWEKVKFILLSYSSRRKVMIPEERTVLLESLEHAAPPGVVELAIMACQRMLHTDPSLAAQALRIFMRRSYPIKNLQLLLYHFPVKKEESLLAARKILTDHYQIGCRTLEGRNMSYREEMEKHALDDKFKRSLYTQEWWNKIKVLLRLCGHENDKEYKKEFADKHLLQAALSNPDTPPSLVQLLMCMDPEAIKEKHPFLHCALIHLICKHWKYNLFPHSKFVGVRLDLPEPAMEQVLKLITLADKTNLRKRFEFRLPLHHAIATGKSIEFIHALIQWDVPTLAARDPVTKLFPYQLAALPSLNKNAGLWAAKKIGDERWQELKSKRRAQAVTQVIYEQDVEQLSTIYHLLRSYPAALTPPALMQKPAGIGKKRGRGMISTHFLKLMYERQPRDGDSVVDESNELDPDKDEWTFLKSNMTLFLMALEDKKIPAEMDEWWEKMKFWIRFCYTGQASLPMKDDYLLHAALANPDTPPLMIELLIALYPNAVAKKVGGDQYPLHIAAATPAYVPQYFEQFEYKNVFQVLLDAYPGAAAKHSSLGLAVDIALIAEHDDDYIEPLLKASNKSRRRGSGSHSLKSSRHGDKSPTRGRDTEKRPDSSHSLNRSRSRSKASEGGRSSTGEKSPSRQRSTSRTSLRSSRSSRSKSRTSNSKSDLGRSGHGKSPRRSKSSSRTSGEKRDSSSWRSGDKSPRREDSRRSDKSPRREDSRRSDKSPRREDSRRSDKSPRREESRRSNSKRRSDRSRERKEEEAPKTGDVPDDDEVARMMAEVGAMANEEQLAN